MVYVLQNIIVTTNSPSFPYPEMGAIADSNILFDSKAKTLTKLSSPLHS